MDIRVAIQLESACPLDELKGRPETRKTSGVCRGTQAFPDSSPCDPWPLAIAVGIFICYNVRQDQEGKLRGIRESHIVKEKTMVGHSHFFRNGTAKAEGRINPARFVFRRSVRGFVGAAVHRLFC